MKSISRSALKADLACDFSTRPVCSCKFSDPTRPLGRPLPWEVIFQQYSTVISTKRQFFNHFYSIRHYKTVKYGSLVASVSVQSDSLPELHLVQSLDRHSSALRMN